MDQNTTTRKELFHVIAEVTKELRTKVNEASFLDDDKHLEKLTIGTLDQTIQWFKKKPRDEEMDKLEKSIDGDSEPSHYFGSETEFGLMMGMSWVRVRDNSGNRTEKVLPIIVVGSKAENQSIILRTSLKWYDHFRPSVIRMKGLIEHARRMRVKRKAIAIEHHLAKIVPDRIDSILLEGEKNEQQAKNS